MADDKLIDFTAAQITFSGRIFRDDAAQQLKDAVGREVQALAREGAAMVKRGIKTRNGTGYSAREVTVVSKGANSLYASVRLPPESDLPPRVYPSRYSNGKPNPKAGQPITGSGLYPAKRVPYIVLAILESGRYGGQHTHTVRARGGRFRDTRKWQHGYRRGGQKPQFFFRATTRYLRAKTPAVREAILRRFAD